MKLETIKSWILTGLVVLSIFLFWNLVTYQQNYDFVKNQDYIKVVNISEKKEIKDLFMPNKIIMRNNHNEYKGSENIKQIKEIMSEIHKWNFFDFQETGGNFPALFENEPTVFIKFPDIIPYDLIKNFFVIDVKKLPVGTFQYMIIQLDEIEQDEGIVYFTSSDFKKLVKSRVRHQNLENFPKLMTTFAKNSQSYFYYKQEDGEYLFILDQELSLNNYQYYPRYYDVDLFKDALFSDPSFVTKNGNRYTDVSSVLDIYPEQGKLSYVDPTVTSDHSILLNDLIQQSVKFINSHSGWTDQYYYTSINPTSNQVIYQLYPQDYPVLNQDGLGQISVVMGTNGVYSYKRPYFSLDISFNPSNRLYKLPSGKKVIEYLEKNKKIDLNRVEDVVIGYQLIKGDPLIKLIPSWFYRMEDSFVKVSETELEGENSGLE